MVDAFEALLRQLLQPTTPPTSTAAAACASPSVCPSPLTKSMTDHLKAANQSSSSKPATARVLFPAPAGCFSQGQGSFSSTASTAGSSRADSVSSQGSSSSAVQQPPATLASLLVAFDDSWLEYLDQFVVWKGRDAQGLEQELMLMAVRLERSMRVKLGRRELDSPEVQANPDLQVGLNSHV